MSLRQSHIDGPSESQKLYGSNLPPSLRWGAATHHTTIQNREAGPRNVTHGASYSQAGPQVPTSHRTERYRTPKYSLYRERDRSRARNDIYELEASNRDKPYAGERFLIEDNAASPPLRVSPGYPRLPAAVQTQKFHATVEDIDDDSSADSVAPVAAGAEGDDDVVVIPSRHELPNDEQLKDRRERPIIITRKDDVDQHHHTIPARMPVYPKTHIDFLSTETLRAYGLPWKYDTDDPNYIIILQELDTHETEALFRHTRRLREGRSHEGSESSDTSDSEPVVVRFRPRLGSQPTKIRVSIDTRVQQPSLQHNLALTNFRHDVTARRARKCRYYGDHPVLPTAEPTFKCVQYATYGDLTRDSTDKMRSPPGLVTASQHQCSVHATLYHVLHLQLDIMDYDNFKNQVVTLPGLHEIRDSVGAHLNKAQKLYEQVLHNGSPTRSMNGYCHHAQATADQVSMTLISMPILQLRHHMHHAESKFRPRAIIDQLVGRSQTDQKIGAQPEWYSQSAYATRTLFQYLNPRNSSRRDLKQVVCQMLDAKDARYLCVSHVWMLVIGEDIMITCSTLSESEVYDDLLLSSTAPGVPPTPKVQSLKVIRAQSEAGRQWLLRPDDCLTYLDFAAHFSNHTRNFANDFKIYLQEEILQPQDWKAMIQRAYANNWSALHLSLVRRKTGQVDFDAVTPFERRDLALDQGPSSGAKDGRTENLDRAFRKFLREVRQHRHKQSGSHVEVTADYVAADFESDHSPVSDSAPNYVCAVEPQDSESLHSSESTTDPDGDDRSRNASFVNTAREPKDTGVDRSSRHNIHDRSKKGREGFRLFFSLPRTSTDAKVLAHMGINFTEGPGEFTVPDGLNESQLAIVMRTTRKLANLGRLRTHTLQTFGIVTGHEATPATDDKPSVRSTSTESSFEDEDIFHEGIMYKTCSEMSTEMLAGTLVTWMGRSCLQAPDPTERVERFSGKSDTLTLRRILGCRDDKYPDVSVDPEMTTMDTAIEPFERLLEGIGLFSRASKLGGHTSERNAAQGKLEGAISGLITTLHQSLEACAELPFQLHLDQILKTFERSFTSLRRLEAHALTIEELHDIRVSTTADQYVSTLRHMTMTILLTERVLREFRAYIHVMKVRIVRINVALADPSSEDEHPMNLPEVQRCCEEVYDDLDVAEADETTESEWQRRFAHCVRRLVKSGWDKEAASVMLRADCCWYRIAYHIRRAAGMVDSAFETALSTDPAKRIQYRVAVLPTDLVALLASRLLWRPVYDGQDALDMYNRYVTDLESNILTGEPSREPLDRIRYLRHELNAFSQLQREQIDVLERIADVLSPLGGQFDYDFDEPHPKRAVLATLPRGIKIQNDVVQMLSGMLDGLQSEARAQLEGVQDWRDNATVVFTIITVIFLPLSFVASVFGMNTADIRDMALTQWVFWTAACSFTVVVILTTVYFVDVPPLWRWLERKGGNTTSSGVRSQATLPDKNQFFASLVRRDEDMADNKSDASSGWA